MSYPRPESLAESMKCEKCGAVHARAWLNEFACVCTLGAVRGGHPDNAEPAEYEWECPDCGARESFEPVEK